MKVSGFRRATPRDIEPLCILAREIWRAHYPPIIGQAQTEYMLAQRYTAEVLRDEFARKEIWWAVAYEDEALVGFASFHLHDPAELKIDKLYVRADHQRKGIGESFIRHASELARACGQSTLVLAVNKRNANAIAAYRKHGFEIREAVVKDIGEGFVMDDYVMARKV